MQLDALDKQKRLRELAGLKAIIDIDFPNDPQIKVQYEKAYNDYIEGLISEAEFDERIKLLVSNSSQDHLGSKFKDETELHLSAEDAQRFIKNRFQK